MGPVITVCTGDEREREREREREVGGVCTVSLAVQYYPRTAQ